VIDETWAVGLFAGTEVIDAACGLDG